MSDDSQPIPQDPGTQTVDAGADIQPSQQLGAPVNLVNPDGEVVGVSPDQLQDALESGYQHASPEQLTAHFNSEKYGTPGQIAKTVAEGASTGLIGKTLTNAIETGMGLASPEDIEGRAAENPTAHGLAETGSFIGGALTGTGEAALLSKAGSLIPKIGAGGSFIARAAAHAPAAIFEGALYQADQEGGKALTHLDDWKNDPEGSAGKAMINIGLVGLMNGAVGGLLGGALSKAAPEAAAPLAEGLAAGEPATFVSGADRAAYEAGDLKTHVEVDPSIPEAKKAGLLDAFKFNKQKPNADEIVKAAETLGAPITPGMTAESPLIQMQVDALANSPYTYSGNKIRSVLNEAYDKAAGSLDSATASANNLTKDELGQSLQQSLTADTRQAYAPVKQAFDEVSALHPQVPVGLEDIGGFREGLKDIKEVALGPSTDEGKLARQVVGALQNAKTADDITAIRNMSALKKSGVGADPMGRIKGMLRDRLQEMQDEVVSKYAKSFPRNDEAGALMSSVIDQNKAAQQAYKPYIKKVQQLSDWMGKGKIYGTEDALNFMNERLSASDVSNRLFSASKDPAFLKFFSKEFPEQFGLVRDYQRMALRDAASTGGEMSPKVFFNKFNKLPKEVQSALYSPEELAKIKASETYIREAFPKSFNPSGTSHVGALRDAYGSPKGMIIANARDALMEKAVNFASPQTLAAKALAEATVKGDNMATKAVKAVFSGAKDAMPNNVIPLASHRVNLDKLVAQYQADPSKVLNQGNNNPIPQYAQAFSNTTGRAVQYLAALKPNNDPKQPLDTRIAPTQAQQTAYNRALDIAQQPLNVLHRIQTGTLTPADMETLTAIYPAVYKNLTQKVMSQITDTAQKGQTIPYQTRLQLSMFMGQPLDSTMTQPAILAIQAGTVQQNAQAAAQQPQNKAPAASSVKGLKSVAQEAQTPSQSRQAARAGRKN